MTKKQLAEFNELKARVISLKKEFDEHNRKRRELLRREKKLLKEIDELEKKFNEEDKK